MIDCEKVKYPNTGLFSFCTQLAYAIDREKHNYNIEPVFLITSKSQATLHGLKHRLIKWYDKLMFWISPQYSIFHATFQIGKYVPSRQKIVLTIHDLNFLYEKSESKADKLKKKVQVNIDRADYLVAISEFARQDVLNHLDTQNKPFDVIYNGCTFYSGPQIEKPLYLPNGEFIFTIGTVLPKKNFHVLPNLLIGNDLILIIAGNRSKYEEKIMKVASELGVDSRVKIIGPVNEGDKDWYYRNCKAFVFPSIAEGFGLPVIEAMHYGKPTFISRHTSLPEIGKDFCFYFDYNFDPEKMRFEFKQGMDEFKNRDINTQIEYAHSYSWENAAKEYCKIYNRLSDSSTH